MLPKIPLAKLFLASSLSIITLLIIAPNVVFAANISSPSYAWSESVGWIKFDSGVGAATVSDSALTGYAYNDNIGWIVLDGVTHDGAGNLSGYAWSESVGYIDFSDVIILDGQFYNYAYNDNIGFISFNCANTSSCGDVVYKVSTTWAPAVDTPAPSSSRSRSGGSVTSQIKNLEEMGKTERAEELREQFNIFPTTTPAVTTSNQLSSSQISQLVEMLISAGVISGDNIDKVRAALASLPTTSSSEFTRDLELNDEGEDVRKLQQYLISKGYSIPAGATGFFGMQTQSALIQFQLSNNISPAVGYFGSITRGFIK